MNLSEYSDATQQVFDKVLGRINGIGAEQYAEATEQRFESRPIEAIVQDTLEEIEDAIAYLAQLHIRLAGKARNAIS